MEKDSIVGRELERSGGFASASKTENVNNDEMGLLYLKRALERAGLTSITHTGTMLKLSSGWLISYHDEGSWMKYVSPGKNFSILETGSTYPYHANFMEAMEHIISGNR